ncbi:MAG: four helix bundle protein [Candidatus Omnitrophica bacterium]|nr:four helix bundle protein [Candidatus Omnitrophota bacterium]MBD3268760.1 four helix bundle protein [Candidatus Omnitrophota bacterium]
MKIKRFEDIQAWQEARILTNMIYEAVRSNKNFDRDLRFKGQITAAGVSTMSNTAEGFDSQSNIEFIKFLIYSRRSCSEVKSHLYVALDQKYIRKEIFDEIYKQAVKVKELIGGFIRYLRNSKRRT